MSPVVVSWNVHGWVGQDQRRDPERSFDVIRDLQADVVALQEVEGHDWLRPAEEAGFQVALGATMATGYGNALLYRGRLENLLRGDLSVARREPRGLIDAELTLGSGPLRVLTTHLGLRRRERRQQVERLVEHVERTQTREPAVIVGDFNDWTLGGQQLRPLRRLFGPLSRIATFPSHFPILPLDRAACRAADRTWSVRCVDEASARLASDHLPLRVEIAATSQVGRDGNGDGALQVP